MLYPKIAPPRDAKTVSPLPMETEAMMMPGPKKPIALHQRWSLSFSGGGGYSIGFTEKIEDWARERYVVAVFRQPCFPFPIASLGSRLEAVVTLDRHNLRIVMGIRGRTRKMLL